MNIPGVRRFLFFLFLFAEGFRALSQQGSAPVTITVNGESVIIYRQSHAILIGEWDYNNGFPPLKGVRNDIENVRSCLEKNGFDVTVTMNPVKSQIDEAISAFIRDYGQDTETRLLFYFAGHGYTLKTSLGEELGYIVPVDAPNPNRDPMGFQAKAMEMAQIEMYAKRIRAKHALFLFDACFSGTLFANSRAIPQPVTETTLLPVRQFITSGSADEEVPDKSIFCEQFVGAIEGGSGAGKNGYLTGTELGEFLQKAVTNYSRETQHPQYGKIRSSGLDKGDFVFITGPAKKEINKDPGMKKNDAGQAGSNTGYLTIKSELTGDLYIGDVYNRTIIENTTVELFNIPTGNQRISLKGDHPFEISVYVDPVKNTVVKISPGK
jgi:hypothetical protein